MAPPRRVGVAGLGAIAKYYLAALAELPGWEAAAVCDLRPAALRPHHGRLPCYADHRALLAAAGLDALLVTVPNHVHAPIAADALRAGVPVCVEKPLALTAAEGRALAALARERGVPLFTAFHRRYNDAVRALRAALPAGVPVASVRVRYLERIEDHIGGESWYLDPRRCGGGCVADNGPNAFDLVRFLLGDVAVTGATVVRDAARTDRKAHVALRAPGGATARVELDWSYPGETKDVEVRLADGRVLRADMLAGHRGFKASLWHEYAGVLRDFGALLDAGGPSREDGVAALDLVEAAYLAGVRTPRQARSEPGDAPSGTPTTKGGEAP